MTLRDTYAGLVNNPEIFLQPWLSPPHTPHLSNFLLESSLPSQPALIHLPCTHTDEVSGEQGVPSTTCGKNSGVTINDQGLTGIPGQQKHEEEVSV